LFVINLIVFCTVLATAFMQLIVWAVLFKYLSEVLNIL